MIPAELVSGLFRRAVGAFISDAFHACLGAPGCQKRTLGTRCGRCDKPVCLNHAYVCLIDVTEGARGVGVSRRVESVKSPVVCAGCLAGELPRPEPEARDVPPRKRTARRK